MTGLTIALCATCSRACLRATRRQATLRQQTEAAKLDAAIAANLKELGYG